MQKFIQQVAKYIFDVFLKFTILFIIGSGAGAIVCWHYSLPIVFSLLGGVLVVGSTLALSFMAFNDW